MYPIINIGPLAFPTTGLVIIFGAYLCLTLAEKSAIRLKQNHVTLYSLATIGLLAGFVGARLAFVVEYWAAFRENLLGIVNSVVRVTDIVMEIATASEEQARGIGQVNKAVTDMDKVVQQSAANAEESSSAAEELAAQAQEMAAMVGKFTIRRRDRAASWSFHA